MEKESKNYLIYIIATIAAMGGLLFGYDTGVISGAMLFIKKQWLMTPLLEGLVVSSILIGAVLGAAFSGRITDLLGRKNVIFITAIIFFFGSIANAFAPDPMFFIISRIAKGIAIGVASYAVPLYISEISPDKIRGALVSMNQLAITIGILSSYFIDQYFATFVNGWRWMFFVGIIPSLILGIGMFFLSDTPRWLVSKNRIDEAKKVLKRLDPTSDIEKVVHDIKETFKGNEKVSYMSLLAPSMKLPLIIGIGLMFFQQLTGINTVIYYAPQIFKIAGFASDKAAIGATIIVGIVNVLFTIVSIKLIDKLGRKPLLFIGMGGMALSLSALGFIFNSNFITGDLLKWISIASVICYIAAFAISLGPIAWLIISEIYPTQIRGIAMSVATLSNWAFNFVVGFSFPSMIKYLEPSGTFWLFTVMSLGGILFCHFLVPETKGIPLEDIQKLWTKKEQLEPELAENI